MSPFIGTGQYQKLYDFGSKAGGMSPYGAPVTDGAYLFGTASDGGASNNGLIYKMKQDGTGFTKLFDFDGTNGSRPLASLLYDGTFLYGTTYQGGANGQGVIFKIKPDGSGFSVLQDLLYVTTGSNPQAGLISDGTFLYGAMLGGTPGGWGGVFKIKPDGSGYALMTQFNGAGNGANPYATLFSDGTFLYGTTQGGFTYAGTVFKVKIADNSFTTMHTFSASSEGDRPLAALISDGTYLYGTTTIGGVNSKGTLFKIKISDNSFTKLLDFSAATGSLSRGALVSDGSFLYGTTINDGANNQGTIFKIKSDGTGFVKLFDMLAGSGGPIPEGTLLLQGTTLFGARSGVGSGFINQYPGNIFRINTDGTGYTSLYDFKPAGNSPTSSTTIEGSFHYGINFSGGKFNSGAIYRMMADGSNYADIMDFDGPRGRPAGDLLSDGTYLYGLTQSGGANDEGTIYKVKLDGTGYTKLYDFSSLVSGTSPHGGLTYDGSFLYGVNANGGAHDNGTIFKIKNDGSGFAILRHFNFTSDATDGASPAGKLYYDGTFLFGTCQYGGVFAGGIIFKIKPDGTSFTKLNDLDNTIDPATPVGGLVSDGTYLYGMGSNGSTGGSGGIFRIKPDGSGYLPVFAFDGTNGGNPQSTLIYDGSFLYGITANGGVPGKGVVFRVKTDGTAFSKLIELTDGYGAAGSLSTDGTWLYSPTQYGGNYSLGTYFKVGKTPFVSINDFQPTEGSVGTYVTITGNEFNPTVAGNVVKFNGVAAEIISATATEIVAVVPVGATDGAITITNSTTGTSALGFTVTPDAAMFDGGTVKNCNVGFVSNNVGNDMQETFLPDAPGSKIKLTFSAFNMHDQFEVYDGTDTSAPLLGTFTQFSPAPNLTATNATGALTFRFIWLDTSTSSWTGQITCVSTAPTPVITVSAQPVNTSVCNGQMATLSTAASGTTNISYQWQFSSTSTGTYANLTDAGAYSGTQTASMTLNTLGHLGEGFYKCLISGDLAAAKFTNVASVTFKSTGCDPVIAATSVSGSVGTTLTINLVPLISTFSNNLDVASLSVVNAPPSGAVATITNGILSVNYAGVSFAGTEKIVIRACDAFGNCATQAVDLTVNGELIVYNAISANSDGKNDVWYIENIGLLDDTKGNHVSVFDRWGNSVFEADNYNNTSVVFDGHGKSGGSLPAGTYFYKITFTSGRSSMTGFLALKK